MATAINVGFGSVISAEKIVAIVASESAPIRRIVNQAKEAGSLIDATYGRKTRSVIIMDSGHVILSTLQSTTICERINSENKKEKEQ